MQIAFTPQQEQLQGQLRDYLSQLITPALRAELDAHEAGGPRYMEAMKQLGRDGWLGLGWPVEYGGQGRDALEEFIFFDEIQRAGFPIPILTLSTVGPTLMSFGSEAQRAAFLPQILRGELHFSIGYTEPSSGTDLASLKTQAVRDGDDYVINGQKIWTSLVDHADYLWLAVRTDPDASKHKGISILIVPTDAPGFSHTRIENIGDSNVHAVYLEDVRVPVGNCVGGENRGWAMITNQLNHERVALMSIGLLRQMWDETLAWARNTRVGQDGRVIDVPWVQMSLARLDARLEVLKLMNWKQAWNIANDQLSRADASAIKVYGSELYVEAYQGLMEIIGAAGTLDASSHAVPLRGRLERIFRATLVLTFGGGTNEVQRDIIAMAGLRMPRSR
jgi:hypothetical protein